jgi:hypothetical protein
MAFDHHHLVAGERQSVRDGQADHASSDHDRLDISAHTALLANILFLPGFPQGKYGDRHARNISNPN